MDSIRDVIDTVMTRFGEGDHALADLNSALERALVAREEQRMNDLSMVGMVFGVTPEIAAKVMCDLELGEPRTQEYKDMVTANYKRAMDQMAAAVGVTITEYPPTTAEGVAAALAGIDIPEEDS